MEIAQIYDSTISDSYLIGFINKYYDFNCKCCTLLKKGVHDTYLITTTGENKFIVRVYRYKLRSINDIKQELTFLTFLKQNNVPVQSPIVNLSGGYVNEVNAPEGIRYIAVLDYIEGGITRPFNLKSAYHFGRCLGQIHFYGDKLSFQLDKAELQPSIITNYSISKVSEIVSSQEKMELLGKISQSIVPAMQNLDIGLDPPFYGICHGDYYKTNSLWSDDDTCTIIDFDFMAFGYRAYDLSMFMWTLSHMTRGENEKKELWQSYLKGYSEIRQLSSKELAGVNYFCALYHIYLLASRLEGSSFKGRNFDEAYWNFNFDYLKNWVIEKCNIKL